MKIKIGILFFLFIIAIFSLIKYKSNHPAQTVEVKQKEETTAPPEQKANTFLSALSKDKIEKKVINIDSIFISKMTTSNLSFEQIRENFQKKHPNTNFFFEKGIGIPWTSIKGDVLPEYSGMDPKSAAMNFLTDHPELFSGTPVGVNFFLDEIKQIPTGFVVIIKSKYQNHPYPSQKAIFFDRIDNLTGAFKRANNDSLSLKEIDPCQKYDQEFAIKKIKSLRTEKTYIARPPTLKVFPSSGKIGIWGWEIYYKVEENRGDPVAYVAIINSCKGSLYAIPKKIELDRH